MHLQLEPRPEGALSAVRIRYSTTLRRGRDNNYESMVVLSIRQSSCVWSVLHVLALYASVDPLGLLPLLMLINVLSTWNALSVFGIFP